MRLIRQEHWGVMLEHDGHLMLLPYRSRFPFPVTHQVVINKDAPGKPDLTVVISTGDFACYVEQSKGPVHIIKKGSVYAQLIETYMTTLLRQNPQ